MELVAAFRTALGDRAGGDELAAVVTAAAERARAAWPQFAIADERLGRRLGELVADEPDPAAALARLHVGDAYLALGCADGIPAALEALERELVPALRGPLHRMGLGAAAIDETLQVMREELLVARDGGARILRYSARGQLRGWLRAVAARTGLRSVAHPNRQLELDDRVAGAAAGDLELAYMKQRYGEVFRRAFQTAVDRLDTADRVLLKQRFRHRLSVEELGALYAVHAGTISRRVAAARQRLVDATRAEMVRELGIQPGEVSSILRLIHSEVAISLSTIDERPPR